MCIETREILLEYVFRKDTNLKSRAPGMLLNWQLVSIIRPIWTNKHFPLIVTSAAVQVKIRIKMVMSEKL